MTVLLFMIMRNSNYESFLKFQSGAAMAPWSYRSDTELEREQSLSLGLALGCETDDTTLLVECLRNVSAEKLHDAHLEV